MWDRWSDIFMGLLFACCTTAAILIFWLAIWGMLPTKQLGYHIEEEVVEKGRIRYYTVVCVREHAMDRTIFTTTDFKEAQKVLEEMKAMSEAQ